MDVDRRADPQQQEHQALKSLLEISDEDCNQNASIWKNNKPRRKYKSTHKAKAIDHEIVISKS